MHVLFTLVWLLALATSAHAECAWVLWERLDAWLSNDIELRNEGAWKPRAGYMTPGLRRGAASVRPIHQGCGGGGVSPFR
jgi:hypothetical protein